MANRVSQAYLIDDHDVVTTSEQGVGDPAADESGTAGHQYGLLAGVRQDLFEVGKNEMEGFGARAGGENGMFCSVPCIVIAVRQYWRK